MKHTKKRDLFQELEQGAREIKQHQAGKTSLRTHKIEKKPHFTPSSMKTPKRLKTS